MGPLLFFTPAGNTLWTYALPSLPFTAILIAYWLTRLDLARFSKFYYPLAGAVPVLMTVFVLLGTQGVYTLKTEYTSL
jgi:4-amino-4-deoxy-L-arabinose transferase-like glycosyltransferase